MKTITKIICYLFVIAIFNSPIKVYAKQAHLGGAFKAYMSYLAITDKTSEQYKLQQLAYTDEQGFRKIDDYYCVAMGNYYADYKCGKKFKVILDTEIELNVIVADVKQNIHTDKLNQKCLTNGSIIEFIVDINEISSKSRRDGDMREFDGNIVSITEIKE